MATPTPPPPQDQPPADDPRDTLQVLGYIMGVVCLGLAWLAASSIAQVEADGGGRLNILVALPYRLGGKALALASCLVPGLGLLGMGVYFTFARR